MKKNALTLIGVLSLLLSAGAAWAQSAGQTIRADIPFSFVVNRQTLPPGQYDISRYSANSPVLLIHGNQENILTMANGARSLNPASTTKLVFKNYEGHYFLSQVWVQGSTAGRELPKSAHEAEVAMDYSSKDVIVLASLQ
jgi:D-alanyl-D-alanine carboxypeptidase